MTKITIRLHPSTSLDAYHDLCDLVVSHHQDHHWLIHLDAWDVGQRSFIIAANDAPAVTETFRTWCAELGLLAPHIASAPLKPEEMDDFGIEADEDE